MILATITLALVAPALSPVQLPVGPLLGPGGGSVLIVDVELSGTERWLLGVESTSIPGEGRTVVARLDGSGTLSWLPPIPDGWIPNSSTSFLNAVGENQILVRGMGNSYRTFSITPQGWQEELLLTPTNPGGTYRDVVGDISGSTVVFSHRVFQPTPLVFDPAFSTERQELPTTPGSTVTEIAVDGDTVIALEQGVLVRNLFVFRRVGGRWTRVGEIESPVGGDWNYGSLEFAFDRGTVAVAASSVSPQDPCPKLYFFEQDASGDFVLTAEFEAASPCATSATVGEGYANIRLVGSELAAVESLDGRADRFERTAQGWERRERVAGARRIGIAWPIGGQLVASSSSSEVFAPVDSPGTTQITCATPAPIYSQLWTSGRTQTTVQPIRIGWTVDGAPLGTPYFLAVGFEPGSRPLGATAELCIGGPVSVVPMPFATQNYWSDTTSVEIDPVAAGLPPGGTLYVQAWRPDPSTSGGLTSNGLSILFAP